MHFQIKDIAERLPPGSYDTVSLKVAHLTNGWETNGVHIPDEQAPRTDLENGTQGPIQSPRDSRVTSENVYQPEAKLPTAGRALKPSFSSMSEASADQDVETGTRSKSTGLAVTNNSNVEAEWIEQYEPGVYITLVALRDGTRDLKRVRFR